MRPRFALAASLVFLGFRCANAPQSPTKNTETSATTGETRTTTGAWIIRSEQDEQTFDVDPVAARLFASVEANPFDSKSREALAARYSATNYRTTSRFFATTARCCENGKFAQYDSEPFFRARCEPGETPSATIPATPLFSSSLTEFRQSLQAALAEFRTMAASGKRNDCKFLVAWADTVRLATLHGLQTTAEEQERAVRILITLADDAKFYPPHVDSTAEVYLAVATLFASAHDYQSSYSAIGIARARLAQAAYAPDQRAQVLAAIDRLQKPVEHSLERQH